MGQSHSMAIDVLGPLELRMGSDRRAKPTAPKERQVLSLLLMNPSQAVPVSVLVDELWVNEPPKTALTIVQTYVLNLRKTLSRNFKIPAPQVSRELLRTCNGGYLFETDGCHFDLREYQRLAAAGKHALELGDPAHAAELLRRADALWRGPALTDVQRGMALEAEVTRLEQARLITRELCIETELRLGRHREVLGELSGLAVQYPYHEHLHGYLMHALHRCGRRMEALDVFHRLRRVLSDELGLSPSAGLCRLQQGILNASESELVGAGGAVDTLLGAVRTTLP
ncbi:AfsR/SARP family transcriptional regulator [Streptomyces sp. NPDC048442]|uniref:AfsR/SARP family transcriptional regulator n=1 Tax=Streptomyces sp. NPDC048442 TaxID=3154823 RepID=UPI00343D62A6